MVDRSWQVRWWRSAIAAGFATSLVGMVMVMLLNARVQSWDSILLDRFEYALGFVVLGVIFSVVNLCVANHKHFRL
jgi:chromate transport protein ChrA